MCEIQYYLMSGEGCRYVIPTCAVILNIIQVMKQAAKGVVVIMNPFQVCY